MRAAEAVEARAAKVERAVAMVVAKGEVAQGEAREEEARGEVEMAVAGAVVAMAEVVVEAREGVAREEAVAPARGKEAMAVLVLSGEARGGSEEAQAAMVAIRVYAARVRGTLPGEAGEAASTA